MQLGWLLPDPAQDVLFDGWKKPLYHPRHGKPPAVLRATRATAAVIGPVLVRYLGTGDDKAMPGAARPAS